MMVHHRLQGWVGSGVTTAQDEIVRQSRGRCGGFKESWRGKYRGGSRGDLQNGGVHVNLLSTDEMTQVKTRERGVQYANGREQANLINHNSWKFGAHPIVGTVCAYDASSNLHAYSFKYVNVSVSGCDCVALEDSGCQIPLVSHRLFLWCCNETMGNVTLHGFGRDQTVRAPLANLTVCLSDVIVRMCVNVRELPIMCAMTDFCSHDYDVILPAAVVCNLQAKTVVSTELYNGITVRGCCKEQPRVNWTTADRLSSRTKMKTTIRSKPRSSHTDSKTKFNLGCGMSHWAYAVVMLRNLCVALLVCIALWLITDDRNVMFARVLIPAPVVLSCICLVSGSKKTSSRTSSPNHDRSDASCLTRSPTSLTTDPGGATRGSFAGRLPTVSCDDRRDPAVHQTCAPCRGQYDRRTD